LEDHAVSIFRVKCKKWRQGVLDGLESMWANRKWDRMVLFNRQLHGVQARGRILSFTIGNRLDGGGEITHG
jgi:hypothetical protein